MPDPNPPRQPFGYGKKPAPGPASPPKAAPPKPASPPKPKVVADDPGFEVVEDDPPPAKPAARRVGPGDRTPAPVPALKPVSKPLRAEAVKAERVEDDEDLPKPKKAKKKKKRRVEAVDEDQESRDRALAEFEWVWPAILLAVGMVMTFAGALGVGGKGEAFHTIGVIVIGMFVSIPVTVVVLMVVGLLLGIEYGRFGPAILKLAAITFVANGIMFVGDWARLPGFVVFPISCFITFGLFMTQFDLDPWETNASVGALNVMSFVANVVILSFLVVAEVNKKDGGASPFDDEDDDVPANVQKKNSRSKQDQWPPPRAVTHPDDEPGDPGDPD